MRTVILLGWALLLAQPAAAVDLEALRDALCERESRGLPSPYAAYGKNRNGTADLGECQINTDTLAWLGYFSYWGRGRDGKRIPVRATRSPSLIFATNREIALEILILSRDALRMRGMRVNVYNLAYKYGCGIYVIPKVGGVCHEGALEVAKKIGAKQ